MEPRERILKIQEVTGMSGRALAMHVGINDYDLKAIRTGKVQKVSQKIADAVVEKFPHFSKHWIMTGEGEMLLDQTSPEEKFPNHDARINELLTICVMQQESINQLHKDITALVSSIRELVKYNHTDIHHMVAEESPERQAYNTLAEFEKSKHKESV